MSREILVSPGINEIAPGWTAIVKRIRPFEGVIPGKTALHEAWHVVPDPRNVRRATNRPGAGYLGLTELYTFDSIAAAGPHAMGDDGTGHDLRLIGIHGHDAGSAASAARSMLAYLDEETQAVARAIESKGEISGFEAEEIMEQVASPQAEIEITDPLGKITTLISRAQRNERRVIVLELPKVA